MKHLLFCKKTKADIYLEFFNDWLTVERMAEHYGITEREMRRVIDAGKMEHESNVLNAIIERKKNGIDCTESESAEIKQYIKNNAEYPPEIPALFPLEYSEAITEIFNQ
jgi:transcriptional antiterminator